MEYSFEQIEDYLEGNLSGDEFITFEENLKNDSALATAVRRQKETHDMVDLYAKISIKDKVHRIHENVKIQQEKESKPNYILQIAASLFVVMSLTITYFLLSNNYSNDTIASNAFELYPDRYTSMGEADEDDFTKGLGHYNKQEFGSAIDRFKEVPASSPDYLSVQFYMGVSYLAFDQAKSSISIFEDLIKKDHLYKEAAQWYLALALLKTNDEAHARVILNAIVKGNFYQHKQAGEILEKLNSPIRKIVD